MRNLSEIEVLYLDDGTFYCTNEYGISCKSFYGLTPERLTCNYTCPSNDLIEGYYINRLDLTNFNFKTFPNPNNGQFNLLLPYFWENSTFIKIYNTQEQ